MAVYCSFNSFVASFVAPFIAVRLGSAEIHLTPLATFARSCFHKSMGIFKNLFGKRDAPPEKRKIPTNVAG